MAPILIDGRGLFKLGSTAVLIAALIFFGGFFSGYNKAADFYQYRSEIKQLALPTVTADSFDNRNPLLPEHIDIGATIDVDQPEITVVNRIHATPRLDAGVETTIDTANAVIKTIKPATKADTEQAAKENSHNPASVIIADKTGMLPEHIKNARYSIQVGMYGNMINAENMKKMLQAQNLNAYISNYKNRKNEVRYNVRFGYFQNKQFAITTLKKYKEQGKGDGYLVSFSIENLVNVAETDNIGDKPLLVEGAAAVAVDSKISHQASPAELSQVDIINTGMPVSN